MLPWKVFLVITSYLVCVTSNKYKRTDICHQLQLDKLFLVKDVVEKKLHSRAEHVVNSKKLTSQEKFHRKKIIDIIHREINDSVVTLHGTVDSLRKLLRGDHHTLKNLKSISKQHLTQLQASMLIIEEDYNTLVDEEKNEISAEKLKAKQNSTSKNILKKFFNDLLGDISVAADKLETELDDDAFEAEIHKNKMFHIETVVKVSGEEFSGISLKVSFDQSSNQFIVYIIRNILIIFF